MCYWTGKHFTYCTFTFRGFIARHTSLRLPEPWLSAGCILTFGVLVTQRCLSHVTEAQRALAAAVDKQVTVVGVKLSRCDHFCQILHVGWLDVHDVWGRGVVQGNNKEKAVPRAGALF